MKALPLLLLLVRLIGPAYGQERVDDRLVGDRIICVLPIIGTGSFDDPKRPLFAPVRGENPLITSYNWVPTDDGLLAIVQFVGKGPAALNTILNDLRVQKVFKKGKDRKADTEKDLKKLKRDFDFDSFTGLTLPGGAR